jgi:exopolysaccharide biosynthesis WecB/TagA/CpsF family protein
MEATQSKPIRHFFYGGAEGVAEDLRSKMEARFPGLQIVGTYCPPFRPLNPEEKAGLVAQITDCKADIVWVGLSTPKQERFMAEYLPILPVKVMLGVGAAFDFHTGRAKQAPRWMMRAGLEWLFRLVTEPKRLWRRYCFQVPRFASLVALDTVGLVSHSAGRPEMPYAFDMVKHWPKQIMLSLMLAGLTCVFHLAMGGAMNVFAFALAVGAPSASFILNYLLLTMVASNEERLDCIFPQLLLVSGMFSGCMAIALPLAAMTSQIIGDGIPTSLLLLLAGFSVAPVATLILAVAILLLLTAMLNAFNSAN